MAWRIECPCLEGRCIFPTFATAFAYAQATTCPAIHEYVELDENGEPHA